MTRRDRGGVADREAEALRGSHDEETFSEAIEQTERERERQAMRESFNAMAAEVGRVAAQLDDERGKQARKIKNLEGKRNQLQTARRGSPEATAGALERLVSTPRPSPTSRSMAGSVGPVG